MKRKRRKKRKRKIRYEFIKWHDILSSFLMTYTFHLLLIIIKDDEEGDEDDDDEGSEMELDEDFPEINAAPHIRFERFDRDDDLIIEFDNMFSNNGKQSL